MSDEPLAYKPAPKVHANRRIKTPDEFDDLVDAYVVEQREAKNPLTITGLTLALGFMDRQSLYDYGKIEEFKASVARARLIVGAGYESNLHRPGATGSIFALSNMGWENPQRINLGNADDKPFEVSDTTRASRLASIVATAQARKQQAEGEGDDDDEECDLC